MIYFLLGIFFVYLGVPFLQAIASWIESISQLLTYKIAQKIYIIKKQIKQDDQEEEEESKKFQIGFQTDCIGYQIPDQPQQEYQDE